jgi:hypothetical protein
MLSCGGTVTGFWRGCCWFVAGVAGIVVGLLLGCGGVVARL